MKRPDRERYHRLNQEAQDKIAEAQAAADAGDHTRAKELDVEADKLYNAALEARDRFQKQEKLAREAEKAKERQAASSSASDNPDEDLSAREKQKRTRLAERYRTGGRESVTEEEYALLHSTRCLHTRIFDKYFRGGCRESRMSPAELNILETRAFTTDPSAGANAGLTIPQSWEAEIWYDMAMIGGMLEPGAARVTETPTGNDYHITTETSRATREASIVEEGAEVTPTDLKFGRITMKAVKYGEYSLFTAEALQDSQFNLIGEVQDAFAEGFSRALNKAMTTSTVITARVGSADKPRITGVLNVLQGPTARRDGNTSVAANARRTITGVAAGFRTPANGGGADAVLDLIHSVDPAYRGNLRLMMHDTTVKALRQFKATDGQYLWRPSLIDGNPGTFAGYPIFVNQAMPEVAANANVIVAYDPASYRIRRVAGMRVRRGDELKVLTDETVLVAFLRADGTPVRPLAFGVLQVAQS